MRLYLKLSSTNEIVPYNHQPELVRIIHKWIGNQNALHDSISFYSFSWLRLGKQEKNGLSFKNGGQWFISAFDIALIKKIVSSIMKSPEVCFGMRVSDIVIEESPSFGTTERLLMATPIFIKRRINGREKHFVFGDAECAQCMTETLKNKLLKAGLDDTGLNVKFDSDYHNPKIKLFDYKGIYNKVSVCPIIIEGTPEQIRFAWEVGIGNSTGIGFGTVI